MVTARETVTTALTGDETLLLHLRRSGNVTPNLYLVERSGRRTAVALARFGLAEGEQVLAIPLREIRDDARQWPNFADVNEIQIVFEWAEMAGTLDLYSLQFASRWQMAVPVATESQALADSLVVHAGFTIRAIADQLRETTQLSVTDDGTLWASTQSGRIWRYTDSDGDGLFDQRLLYATGFEEVVGLLYDPTDGALWVGDVASCIGCWMVMGMASPISASCGSMACRGDVTRTMGWPGTLTGPFTGGNGSPVDYCRQPTASNAGRGVARQSPCHVCRSQGERCGLGVSGFPHGARQRLSLCPKCQLLYGTHRELQPPHVRRQL
ncbi:MAG: hypothetical protein R2932_35845 [Caldilineaceae bacterium]